MPLVHIELEFLGTAWIGQISGPRGGREICAPDIDAALMAIREAYAAVGAPQAPAPVPAPLAAPPAAAPMPMPQPIPRRNRRDLLPTVTRPEPTEIELPPLGARPLRGARQANDDGLPGGHVP